MNMIYGWQQDERKQFLKNTETIGEKFSLTFQGEYRSFPVFRVPIDLARYRLNNIRTMALQEELIHTEELDEDFFSADPESNNVQARQHQLLSTLTHESGLDEKFKNPNEKQTYPLVLTSNGTTANGNRRLTSWRNLYISDPSKYAHFAHVNVIVLPDCEEKDIVRLEAGIQLEKDITSAYGWATTAIGLRRAINPPIQLSHTEAANLYAVSGKNPNQEVQKLIDGLEYGEHYLDSRNATKQYSLITDKEFAFKEMVRLRPKTKAWPLEKIMKFELLAFALIEKPEGHGRVYTQITSLFNNLDAVITSVEEDLGDKITKPELISSAEDSTVSSEILDFFVDDEENTNITTWKEISVEELGEELQSEVIVSVWDAIESAKALTKAGNKNKFVYSKVNDAHKLLQQAITGAESSMRKDGVDTKLTEISSLIDQIREWLENGEN